MAGWPPRTADCRQFREVAVKKGLAAPVTPFALGNLIPSQPSRCSFKVGRGTWSHPEPLHPGVSARPAAGREDADPMRGGAGGVPEPKRRFPAAVCQARGGGGAGHHRSRQPSRTPCAPQSRPRWPNPCAVKGPWHRSHRHRDGTLGLYPQPDVSVSAGTWRAGLEDRRRGRPYRYAPPAGRRDRLSQVRSALGLDSHRWIRRAPRARTTPDPTAR